MAATLKASTVKALAEKHNLTEIPPIYNFQTLSTIDQAIASGGAGEDQEPIPVIDFSLLTSGTPDQRSPIVRNLGNMCRDWGCFMVINHRVDEGLINKILDSCKEFFDQEEEVKREYEGKHTSDPICHGTGADAAVTEVLFWRDYLRVMVHPEFHSPSKPAGEVLAEFTNAIRGMVRDLLGGISESLGLESSYMDRALNLESSLQFFDANLYPPCPQPELAVGLPPHTDHGLLTVLIQNGINGLQVQHEDKWVAANIIPGAFFVNIGDQLEVFTNGKYKSVFHRAAVNNTATRISIAVPNGPSADTIVKPVPELLDNGSCPAAYAGMKYKDYLELQHGSGLKGRAWII
ncbi:hypothetical protein CDL15_Pgr024149 [Punica granatum]|uniref:Fe2OG dioxygenase domain-containing protein n=1 Tax=Punica granatum TaxID=22663 RepID=A0A218XY29_PUNGR|nr:hypothetical protein CDL15_Pgr024149 [Punica granatum]PKI40384.1 hypothetical protein CRG98_039230 [Punica granatum]